MFDCKQLMVYDYVSVGEYFPSPIKVLEILYEGEECIFNLNGDPKNIYKEDIWPIALTKEFFINNGFEILFDDKQVIKLYNREHSLKVNITDGNKFEVCPIGYMEYVHEFQHLLRMFKLYEYADNLKV